LRPASSAFTPPASFLMTLFFQSRSLVTSVVGLEKLTPKSAAWAASPMILATCKSALLGMQPSRRQTPPGTSAFSTRVSGSHDRPPQCRDVTARTAANDE
jgi:hypothetical protein